MPQLTVTTVQNVNEWQSNFGPMLSWRLSVTHPDGQPETIDINSKPDKKYQAGDSFYAERTGQEYRGVFKYKRQKPPDGYQAPRGNAPQSSQEPRTAVSSPPPVSVPQSKPPMPYDDAIALFAHMTEKLNQPSQWNGIGTQLLMAIVLGKIENPVRPKHSVVHFGNVIETGGIEQADFDEVMKLSDELAALTDQKNVRALLIATAGVSTRKDLDAEKAKLFIETLKLNIVAARRKPQDDDETVPF